MTKMRLTARRTEAEATIDNLNAKTSQGLYCLKLNRLIIIHLSHSQLVILGRLSHVQKGPTTC